MSVARHFSSLSPAVLPAPSNPARTSHVVSLFSDYEREVLRRTNQFFSWLLALQWVFAVAFALIWSPQTWAGRDATIHLHVFAATLVGGLLTLPPIWLMRAMPYELLTRHVVAVAQMGFSALLIDLTGGRIETHFHVFGSLAFLALYRDWRVLPTATLVVALDHLLRGIWFPESVYGVPYATIWRTAEHAGWVIFEDIVLAWACLVSRREMWEICCRHDENATLLEELEERVTARTSELKAEIVRRETIAQDLTRSEERYRQLIANVPIGIVETTRAGEVRLANPHMLSLLRLNPAEGVAAIDMADGHIFPTAERQRFWQELDARGQVRGFETTLQRRDGESVHVVLNARLRAGSAGAAAICESTVEDITERKRAAAEMETMHRKLVDASRQAGRADVATGVLHNVGNVLTSVNLIVHDVQDRLRASRIAHLHRVVVKLQQEKGRLPEFLTTDPAGIALPDFLVKLDQYLMEENDRLRGDVETLVGHFEHIRQIIVVQQSSARLYGITETVTPAALIDEALRLNNESFHRHGITLLRIVGAAPAVRVDRHKVMQILVNLLKNAKDSVLTAGVAERIVTVKVATAADKVALIVSDTGVGIPAENLKRIFQHGFTTKTDGHGFGLHSCALAAREMGGDLAAASDGPGRGASFSLLLPVSVAGPA